MTCKKDWVRRAIAFAGAVIITFNIAAAPQRARAVAVSAYVVASVVAIMTACGVSYWASNQQDAVDFIGSKIDDYFASLEDVPVSYEEWLGISGPSELFEVVAGGVMRFTSGIANKVLDFVRWFSAEEGIESDGPVVSNANLLPYISGVRNDGLNAGALGSASATVLDASHIRFDFSDFQKARSGYSAIAYAVIDGCALGQYTATISQRSWSYPEVTVSSTNVLWSAFGSNVYSQEVAGQTSWNDADITFTLTEKYQYLSITFKNAERKGLSGYVVVEVTPAPFGTPASASVTPSDYVAIPDDISEGDTYDVTPSVPLTQGMSVSDATDAIYDGITSEGGLTSEGETGEGAAAGWGWLADLLERIRQAVRGTQEAVEGNHEAVQGIQEAVEGTQEAVEGTQEAVQGIQEAVEGIQEAVQPEEYYEIQNYQLNLTNFFPFCIPWDLFRGLSLLVADPVAPSIDWEVPLPDGSTYTLSLDFSEFDGVAQVARTMELLVFVVALAVATKKLIKW